MKQVPLTADLFEGAISLETTEAGVKPWRLPYDKLDVFPPEGEFGPALAAEHSAGVRLRFQTNSATLSLRVARIAEGERFFDVTVAGEIIASMRLPAKSKEVIFTDLPASGVVLELWLPQNFPTVVESLSIESGTYLRAVADTRPRWVTYGSSITHCIEAHSPARTWPAIVARKFNLNLTCMGYGGQCHLDPMIARVIGRMSADFISMKVPINICGSGSFNQRSFRPAVIGFIQTLRDAHRDIPIAVLSAICAPDYETNPNIVGFNLKQMRAELADAVERLVAQGDKNLFFFSGLDLLDESMVKEYLGEDLLHPNGDGYERIGQNFIEKVMKNIPLDIPAAIL